MEQPERHHHWEAEENDLIRKYGDSMTAERLREEHLPWRSVPSLSKQRLLLKKPPKKRTRFPMKRLIGTEINGRKVTGIDKVKRQLIAVCDRGHEVRCNQATLRRSHGCGECKNEDYVTVEAESDGKAPLTPSRWLGKVIHGQTVIRLTDPQRVVVACENGHEASPVFPCNVRKSCRTCKRERIHRLREEKWVGKTLGTRRVIGVDGCFLLVECIAGHRVRTSKAGARDTGCGECYKLETSATQWIGFSAGGRTIVGVGPSAESGGKHFIAECEEEHRAAVRRATMHKTKCRECIEAAAYSHYPEYSVWRGMLARCNDPNNSAWKYYGGRGIKVLFKTFMEFYIHIGARKNAKLSVNRIDNDGHYEAGNVEWATDSQQARNRSNNRLLTYQGRTQCITDWLEELDLSYGRVDAYLKKGLPVEEAFDLSSKERLSWRDRPLTVDGVTKTYQEWSEETGLPANIILGRVKSGWASEKIVSTPIFKGRLITVDGESLSATEWGKRTGMRARLIYERVFHLGWDPKRALTQPVHRRPNR